MSQVGVPVKATRAAVPADNPQNPEKIALGEELFFAGSLSVGGTVASSTCHDPARAFTDVRPVFVGVKGCEGQRNAPTILNSLYNVAQFWDGRAQTLEDQAPLPVINPCEMGQPNVDAAVAIIAKFPQYQQAFRKVLGRPPNGADLVRAKRGWKLFNSNARCNTCHALSEDQQDPTYLMDKDLHNIGIGINRHNVVAAACRAEQQIDSGNLIDVDRCHSVRHVRAWPVSGYQERSRHRVVQNPGAAQPARYGAVLSRWFAGDVAQLCGFASRDKFKVTFPVTQTTKDVCQTRKPRSLPEHPRVLVRVWSKAS